MPDLSKCPQCGHDTNTYRHPNAKVWCPQCGFVLRQEGEGLPPMSLIVPRQGFDCVIKGFRVGRQARRPSWAPGVVLTYDPKTKEISLLGPEPWGSQSWDPDYLSQDVMAEDWEVWG